MTEIKQKLKQEIDRFQTIVAQYQKNEIKQEAFYKQLRHFGIYPQTQENQFTLRLFSACGILSISQLLFLKNTIQEYAINELHFTTGQNIHLHNLSLAQLPQILLSALEQDLFFGTVGKLPLHIGLSPLSGVFATECFDPTPYAKFLSNYFANNNQQALQNNYKIAFSNSQQDTAFATISDIGFLTTMEEEQPKFQLYLGGGFHHHIIPAIAYPELVEPNEVLLYTLAYIELVESLTNECKKPCAIIQNMETQAFLSNYQARLQAIKLKQDLPIIDFSPSVTKLIPNHNTQLQELNCLFPQKQTDLFSVLIHPANGILPSEKFIQLMETIKYYKNVEARLGFQSSLYLINLTLEQANHILQDMKEVLQQTKVEQSISCTGLPMCPNGKARCQELLYQIVAYLNEKQITHNYLPCICVSGCENSCTRHQVGYIGFEGKTITINNQPQEVYDVYIGGKVGNKTTCGTHYGMMLASKIPEFIYQLSLLLADSEMDFPVFYRSNPNEFDTLIQPFLYS